MVQVQVRVQVPTMLTPCSSMYSPILFAICWSNPRRKMLRTLEVVVAEVMVVEVVVVIAGVMVVVTMLILAIRGAENGYNG